MVFNAEWLAMDGLAHLMLKPKVSCCLGGVIYFPSLYTFGRCTRKKWYPRLIYCSCMDKTTSIQIV